MSRIFTSGVLIALLSAGSALVLSQAPSPPRSAQPPSTSQTPQFRTGVEYVEVDVRVYDSKGDPVRNLRKEDFRLLEDGKEQVIDSFAAIDIPVELHAETAARPAVSIDPDVATNVRAETDGRTYVILLDDLQIDAQLSLATIRIVKDFIQNKLAPHDFAAVVSTSGRTDLSQSFTNNKAMLSKAVEGFVGRRMEPASSLPPSPFPSDPERFHEVQSSFNALEAVARWMGAMRGRGKALVLVSQGVDYNDSVVSDPLATMVVDLERDAIAAATRANVTIYTIDPRALGTNVLSETRIERERSQISLRGIADLTGGVAAINTNKFSEAFDRVVTNSSFYYLIGYYPKNGRRDGKFRDLSVRVNRRGLRVVAKRGYNESEKDDKTSVGVTGPPSSSSEARIALNSPLPITDITLRATAIPFRSDDFKSQLAVIIESPGENLVFVEDGGKFTGELEVVTAAVDPSNTIVASEASRISFGLRPETLARMKAHGFRTLSRLSDLQPGRYQVRVAVSAPGSSRRGSVWYDVDVPDFSKGDVGMSGILLLSPAESAAVTGNPDNLFSDAQLPAPPTTVRRFRVGDEIAAFAEVYDNRLEQAHDLNVTAILRAAHGEVVARTSDWTTAEDLKESDGTYRALMRIPLAGLAVGPYVLSIEAELKIEGVRSVVRMIPLEVVP